MKRQKFLLSWGGVGYFPKAPGTMGSLATLPLIFAMSYLKFSVNLSFTLILLVVSIICAEKVQNKLQVFDPGWIVVDEVLGMLTAWLFIPIWNWRYALSLFLIFRFFDIVKIWPANWVDKKIKSGAGTILDDIVSGIYTGLIFLGIRSFFPALAKWLEII